MNIYTRNGDFGTTTNLQGNAVSKGSHLMELQGSIDEVNSFTGLLRSQLTGVAPRVNPIAKEPFTTLLEELKSVQHQLFLIGSDISEGFILSRISDQHVIDLEHAIDRMLSYTGELHQFIYLSGPVVTTTAHCLRSITRRAERAFVRYIDDQSIKNSPPIDYKYLNRLADYFFQVARFINWALDVEESSMTL